MFSQVGHVSISALQQSILRRLLLQTYFFQEAGMNYRFFVATLCVVALLSACGAPLAPEVAKEPVNKIQDLPVNESLAMSTSLNSQADGDYDIDLQIVGNPTDELLSALESAASRWQGVISSDLQDVSGTIPANSCGSNPDFSGAIDDVLIFAGVTDIDGSGGVLAQAGPCFIRTSSGLTIAGTLVFDTADVSGFSGQLDQIAVHEMGHILGIGTLWDTFGLIIGAGGNDPAFIGSQAMLEYNDLGGFGLVPVENTGGGGTRDGHWRESVFDNELMTGFLNDGSNPLSRLTIASLADLGYDIDLGAADDYALPSGALQAASSKTEFKTELLKPVARVN
jgi:Leishmanolysin